MGPKKHKKDDKNFDLSNKDITNANIALGGGKITTKHTKFINLGEDQTDGNPSKSSKTNTLKNVQFVDSKSKISNDDLLVINAPAKTAEEACKVLEKIAQLNRIPSTENSASEELSRNPQATPEMVTFNVKGESISVKKCILEEKAPQFWSIFADKFRNYPNGPESIEDTDPTVFRQMIHFIEFEAIDDSSPIDEEGLFIAADEYLLDNLKQECERLLVKSLTDENAIDLWILGADRYADTLKSQALARIVNNPAIEDTDNFKLEIIKKRKDLALSWYKAKGPKKSKPTNLG